jgi:hypothetical protein
MTKTKKNEVDTMKSGKRKSVLAPAFTDGE